MKPSDYASSDSTSTTVHVTVNSFFFGFIDDLYFLTYPYGQQSSQRAIKMQSQLRMGKSDFEQNYNHIKTVLDCIDSSDKLKTVANPAPCSLTDK